MRFNIEIICQSLTYFVKNTPGSESVTYFVNTPGPQLYMWRTKTNFRNKIRDTPTLSK